MMPESQTVSMPWTPIANLAPYACDPTVGRGRAHAEPPSAERNEYQRDRDRVLHSGAFRKLEYKTQVFVYHEGDYFRTRLTHSLEVAQVARSVSRSLGLHEDLAEVLALAHDLGHTPFGHAGENALHAVMEPFGGFDHNEQSLRVLVGLEQRYADFDGLNLTWETLEGVVKHNGPVAEADRRPTVLEVDRAIDLRLDSYASGEAQVAALADDIAYNAHDIDDGLRAEVFDFGDLAELPVVGPVLAELRAEHGGLVRRRMIHELVRRVFGALVADLLAESRRRLIELDPQSPDDIRAAGRPVIDFSESMRESNHAVKSFLFKRMYRHYKVNRMASKTGRVVRDLFRLYMEEPNCLPPRWQLTGNDQPGDMPEVERARLVADYIAGMTDRYALLEHDRLFDINAKT